MANQAKVAEIYAELQLSTSKFKAALGEATNESRKFAAEMRRSSEESRASIALLGETIGVHLPRHLRSFVAELPGVSRAMSAAFEAVAVIALIDVIVKAGEKVYEFVRKNEEAATKNAEAWQKMSADIAKQTLELNVQVDKIQDEIAKLQNKPPKNGLKDALDEARKAAFDLDEQLTKDIETAMKLLESQDIGFWHQAVTGASGNESAQRHLEDIRKNEQNENDNYSQALNSGKLRTPKEAEAAQQEHFRRLEKITTDGWNQMNEELKGRMTLRSLQNAGGMSDERWALEQKYGTGSQDVAIQGLQSAMGPLGLRGWNLSAQARLSQANDSKTALDAGQTIATEFMKRIESEMKALGITEDQRAGFLLEHLSSAPNAQARLLLANKAIDEDVTPKAGEIDYSVVEQTQKWKEQQYKDDEEAWAKHVKYLQTALEEMFSDIREKASADLALINYNEATGNFGKHDAAMQTAAVHQEQYRAALDALNTAESQGINVTKQRTQVEAEHNKQVYEDAIATESAFDQMFDHIRQGARDTEQKIASIVEHTLDGINDQLVNGMFGGKTNFHKVFEQSERSLAKVALQWVEGSLLGKGNANKGKINELQLATTNNALNVHIASTSLGTGAGSSSTSSGGSTSPLSSIPGLSSIGDSIKNSSVGQWLSQNGSKYLPGAMSMIGGLVDMFQGPQHTKGEGSGVANALADANHKQNSLSRYLMGFGQLAKGAGSMMFADAGGMGGFDNALMKSDMSSGMASFLSNFTSGLGFATGGDVPYGGVFPVGELGPEKVFLPRGSHVVPNKDIGHGGQVLNIDARGTDPALTKANVARAIASSNAHAVSQAQARMVDRQRRVPRG